MIKILFLYFENSIHWFINLDKIINTYGLLPLAFLINFGFLSIISIISTDFSSPKKNKKHTISFLFYLLFQGLLLVFLLFIIITISSEYPIYKGIYFYLKNLINVQLISLKNDFIMFYISIIFFFFILTIIIIPIILIYSYINKIPSVINTKYNLKIILTLIIFGIIGIIYSLLLNNLRYLNIINLTDIYLISLYLSIYLLLLNIVYINRYYWYAITARLGYNSLFIKKKHIKEINVKKVKGGILAIFILFSLILGMLIFYVDLTLITSGFIPWYAIIFLVFYLYIIFEIIVKRYFSNKETFYQGLYKLNKYFNKNLLIIFGALAFVAVFDTLNLFLLKKYTLQIVLQPVIIDSNLLLQASLAFSVKYVICFILYCILYYHNHYLQHIPSYYNFAENIGYKIDDDEIKIKNIQVNPMMTLLSYFVLLIVFLINLML
jgi:hypothetical protein